MSDVSRPPLPDSSRLHSRRISAQISPPLAHPERSLSLTTSHLPISTPPGISPNSAQGTPDRVRTIDCLVAGKNPITNKVLETMLVRLGCRCVVVPDGGEAILAANSVRFDIIWMDLQMSPINGEKAARMIKSTRSMSMDSLIVAICSYGTGVDDDVGTLFSAILSKPILKDQVLSVMRKLGFQQKKVADSSRRPSAEDVEERRGSAPTVLG